MIFSPMVVLFVLAFLCFLLAWLQAHGLVLGKWADGLLPLGLALWVLGALLGVLGSV